MWPANGQIIVFLPLYREYTTITTKNRVVSDITVRKDICAYTTPNLCRIFSHMIRLTSWSLSQ